MMNTWNEVKLGKEGAADFGLHSSHLAVVLSLVLSLTAVAIISKNLVNSIFVDLVAFTVPIPIALYFENRLSRFRVLTYVAAIVLSLGAAIVFGI